MWTIDDAELHRRLLQPLVLRPAQVAEAAQQPKASARNRMPERGPNGEYFPWQFPFPDEKEWREFLAVFFHELRDKPEAKRAIFDIIEKLARGAQPNGEQA